MLRTALAVFIGFIVWTVLFLGGSQLLSAVASEHIAEDGSTSNVAVLVSFLALSVIASIAGGWVTAKTAKESSNMPAMILGGVLLLVGIGVQISYWETLPVWYHLLFLGFLYPAASFGGRLVKPTP